MTLSEADRTILNDIIGIIASNKEQNIKGNLSVGLSQGTAKIYHMGKTNPVIRIDLYPEVKE